MVYPDNKSADEHFENLRKQFAENLQRLRGLCDVATDSNAFVEQSYKAMEKHAGMFYFDFMLDIHVLNTGLVRYANGKSVWLLTNIGEFWGPSWDLLSRQISHGQAQDKSKSLNGIFS